MKHVPLRRFSKEAFEKAKAVSSSGSGEPQSEYKLPHARVFHQMVETCFWSSLQQQERRNQKFKFFYCDLALIDRLLFHVFRRQFGGAVLFVPDNLVVEAVKELKFRHIVGCPDFWNHFLALLPFGYSHFSKDERVKLPVQDLESRINDLYEKLQDHMDFMASLSQVDGAVLLSKKMKLIGFGGEIRVDDKNLPVTYLKNSDEKKRKQIDPLKYGTRHRSTIRFCKRFPGAVGFVFSQDGAIKAVKGSSDDVTLFNEINRMRYDFFF